MATKPSIPKGTRDFSPVEMAKRNYIFDTIRTVFHHFGFQQIETPAMENLSTLMGKYGDEGDKLLFKIQNSGDYFSGLTDEELLSRNAAKLASKFCEKGLRYDLTVPFARYVVMHRDELTFPFKRFQIQPVWRADRPQKGRYREFYQCDADVVGSDSLLNEVELVQMIDAVFTRFGVRVSIKINNRKILSGIAEIIGEADKIVDITVAIDKLDKIGLDNVNAELASKGIPQEAIDRLQPIILLSGTNAEKLATLKEVLAASETGMKGVEESEFILDTLSGLGIRSEVELDLTLARGLNYYTGAIFEVKALDVQIGSISGGGRYDNLTGVLASVAVLKCLKESGIRFEHTEVAVLLTGSEEAGLRGAFAWARKHKQEIMSDGTETVFVGLETLRDWDHLNIYNRDLTGTVAHDAGAVKLLDKASAACGRPLKHFSVFFGASDAAAVTKEGLRATCLAGMDPTPADYYHNVKDTADNMDRKTFALGLDIAIEAAEIFDRDGAPE